MPATTWVFRFIRRGALRRYNRLSRSTEVLIMTRTKSILAACLSLALVSSSLGAAPSAMAQTLRPADGLKARTDAPLTGEFIGFSVLRSSVTPAALKTPARTPYFKPGFANAANKPQKPTASGFSITPRLRALCM